MQLRYVSRGLLFGLLGLVTVLIAVSASAKLWPREPVNNPPTASNLVQPVNPPRPERTVTLLPIQIGLNGILPREITQPAGSFEFLMINASGEPDLTLQLAREKGGKLETLKPQRGRNLKKRIHLPPGSYQLSVVERPDWICRLTITTP